MRIAYTHHAFCLERYGGVSRYFAELAPRVAALQAGRDVDVLAMAHYNAHLRAVPAHLVTGGYVPHLPKTWRMRRALNDWLTRRTLARNPPAIVHETYYGPARLAPQASRTVLSVYDMTYERYPDAFARKDRTAEEKAAAVERADHIICISHHTRRELLELLAVPAERTTVVHLGCSLRLEDASPTSLRHLQPFLLFVGDRGTYKNFTGLLRAVSVSSMLRCEVKLVCYGGGPFERGELALMRKLDLDAGAVIHLSGGDAQLVRLYRDAAALVNPSLSEGFGLPALEAMALECPVVCSNSSSFPEVVGDAAALFDPSDPQQIATAIEDVLSSPRRAADLRAKGRQRARMFSWDRCAAQTYDVYRTLV
jgi:glycosyltransferase involved in cell wall biosynthesis